MQANHIVLINRANQGADTGELIDLRVVVCAKHLAECSPLSIMGSTSDSCYLCDSHWYASYKLRLEAQRVWLQHILPAEVVYLSGPMSGLPDFNKPNFWMMEHILKQTSCIVKSPAHYDHDYTYEWAMREGFRMIIDSQVIVMLLGWEKSEGAKAELKMAQMCGCRTYYEI